MLVDSWAMGRSYLTRTAEPRLTSTGASKDPSPGIYLSSPPRNLSWSSTSKRPRRSASRSRPRCCCGRIRSSSDAAPKPAAVDSRGPADPIDSNDDFRRGHVAYREDGMVRGARHEEQDCPRGLVELTATARRPRAALAAVLVQAEAPELALVHRWLDNWHGVGLLTVGLHRIGYDLDLRQYGDGNWRASFSVTGLAHSILGGSAWEPTAWRAVQRAGWDAIQHAERNLGLPPSAGWGGRIF